MSPKHLEEKKPEPLECINFFLDASDFELLVEEDGETVEPEGEEADGESSQVNISNISDITWQDPMLDSEFVFTDGPNNGEDYNSPDIGPDGGLCDKCGHGNLYSDMRFCHTCTNEFCLPCAPPLHTAVLQCCNLHNIILWFCSSMCRRGHTRVSVRHVHKIVEDCV